MLDSSVPPPTPRRLAYAHFPDGSRGLGLHQLVDGGRLRVAGIAPAPPPPATRVTFEVLDDALWQQIQRDATAPFSMGTLVLRDAPLSVVEKANAKVASLTPRGHVTQADLDAFEEEVKRRVPGSAALIEKAKQQLAGLDFTPLSAEEIMKRVGMTGDPEEDAKQFAAELKSIRRLVRRKAAAHLWYAAQEVRVSKVGPEARSLSAVLFEASATLAVAKDDAEARAFLNRDAGILGDLGWVPDSLRPTVRKALDVLAPWVVAGTLSAAASASLGVGVSDDHPCQ